MVRFDGVVTQRSAENINPKLPTGSIELVADDYEVLGSCDATPFSVFPEDPIPEEMRLEYRYLDLRRSKVHQNIILRSKVIAHLRQVMTGLGFNEFQTPILTSSSPEGARDFLVPSRLHPGKFYALPQAPQQFKQLLMVAGFDRYFQIAPCFRDEDARADRSPGEFYQLDIEMSFVTQEDVFRVVEEVLHSVFTTFSSRETDKPPFKRIPYREAMLNYGTDKPDLRNPLIIEDVSSLFDGSGFKVFASTVAQGGVVRAIVVKNGASQPRAFFDRMVQFAQSVGSQGLAYLTWNNTEVKGPIAKFLDKPRMDALAAELKIASGDVAFFICNDEKKANRIAGEIRTHLAEELNLIEKDVFRFCWITDFPMYELNEETGRLSSLTTRFPCLRGKWMLF